MRRARRSNRGLVFTLAVLTAIGVALGSWAFVFEPASLRTEAHQIALPAWPAECAGLRIAVLGDLHVGSPYQDLDKLGRIVAATNAARPDLVLLPGDFVVTGMLGGNAVEPERIAAVLAGLKAEGGVLAVLGNHDWWYDGAQVRRSLETVGIPVLEDTARESHVGPCRLWVAGISDFLEGKHDVRAALARVPPGATLVAFTHNPDVFPEIPRQVALTIAAHTHGGQVYIPFIGRPIVPSLYRERFAIGHIVEDGRHLFVHSGIGTSIMPVRFLVPPEIAVVELSTAPVAGDGLPRTSFATRPR